MKAVHNITYYVGDPIHVLGEENMLEIRNRLAKDDEAEVLLEGQRCWVCRVHKDAAYFDQNMNEFSLPSGIIGLIHPDVISDPDGEELGTMMLNESMHITCEREVNGEAITIGDLIISKG